MVVIRCWQRRSFKFQGFQAAVASENSKSPTEFKYWPAWEQRRREGKGAAVRFNFATASRLVYICTLLQLCEARVNLDLAKKQRRKFSLFFPGQRTTTILYSYLLHEDEGIDALHENAEHVVYT